MFTPKITRIIVADGHPVVRLGTRILLDQDPTNEIVGEAGNVDELVSCLDVTHCDLVVLSLQLKEGRYQSGTAAVAAVRRRFPYIKIVAFPDKCSIQAVRAAISLGVLGIVSKSNTTTQLVQAVEAAKRGQRFVASELYQSIIGQSAPRRISPAEETVLQLLAEGSTVSEIAETLGKTTGTISAQKHTAMHKLGLSSTADLYAFLSSWRPTSVVTSANDARLSAL